MKKCILKFLVLFCVLVLTTSRVSAVSLAKAGDTVVQEGDYDSIRLVAGNKVVDKANINGIAFVAGNDVTAQGNSTYGFYAGNNININENISKDLFVAGNKIIISDDAVIGRDAFIAGASVTIMANITRDLRVGANIVDISGITINGDAYLMADNIKLDEDTVIIGKLTYLEDAKITGLDLASVGAIQKTPKVKINIKKNIGNSIMDVILRICAGIVIMLLLFYLIPKTKDKLDKTELKFEIILKTVCIGFLLLILVPMTFLLTVFTNVLTPFALILACMYGISIYLGTLLSGYIVGNLISKAIFNKDNKYLALVIGIVLVKLVKFIPFLGGFIGVICMLYGMGLITIWIKQRNI